MTKRIEHRSQDQLLLEGLSREVDIGVFEEERGTPQKLNFDIQVTLKASPDARHDQIDDILSYDELIYAIDKALAQKRYNLLEHLGEAICECILVHDQVDQVALQIFKPDRIEGRLGISMLRNGLAQNKSNDKLLDQLAICFCTQTSQIKQAITDQKAPLIVLANDAPLPDSKLAALAYYHTLSAQAYHVCAQHPELQPSRTLAEFRYGFEHGRAQIWLPDHLLLAASDAPPYDSDAWALAQWLKAHIGATELCYHGDVND